MIDFLLQICYYAQCFKTWFNLRQKLNSSVFKKADGTSIKNKQYQEKFARIFLNDFKLNLLISSHLHFLRGDEPIRSSQRIRLRSWRTERAGKC